MPSPSDGAERNVLAATTSALKSWLGKARDAVMAPWRRFKATPNADAIAATVPAWQAEVDRILQALEPALREGWAAANLPGDMDIGNPYIQANLALTKNLLVRIPDEVHALVVNAILKGTDAGEPTSQIANRVQDVLSYTGSEDWPGRAQTIAQTETNRHFNSSMLAHGLLREQQGVRGLQKRWDTRMDGRERPAHAEADNQVRPLLQPFLVGGENLMFPVDPTGRPDNTVNCVPGNSVIRAANISVGYRFAWRGATVTLFGEHGLVFTASPNHPILTERGWVALHEAQKGDYLLRAAISDNLSTHTSTRVLPHLAPNVQGVPATAEQIFQALRRIGHCQRVHDVPMNFYGDRPNGQVDIVFAERKLTFGVNTPRLKQFEQLMLAYANLPCASGSSLESFFRGHFATSNSVVRSGNLTMALVDRHSAPFKRFSFRFGPEADSEFLESGGNGAPIDPKSLGEFLDGNTGVNVLRTKVQGIKINTMAHQLLYTFQVDSGAYSADNVTSRNCRCELRILGELS